MPPPGGTVTWPKKHRKYLAPKEIVLYVKLELLQFQCNRRVVQPPPPPKGGTVTSWPPPPHALAGGTVTILRGGISKGG